MSRSTFTRRRVLLLTAGLVACRDDRPPSGDASPTTATAHPTPRPEETATASSKVTEAPPPLPSTTAAATASSHAAQPADKPKETPHALRVPAADVAQGAAKSYTVSGDGHTHPITVDAASMAKLKATGFALVRSGMGGPTPHRHWVGVNVA